MDGSGPHGSQHAALYRLLQLEDEARDRVRQTEERAERLLADAEARAARIVAEARSRAEAEAQRLIQAALAEAEGVPPTAGVPDIEALIGQCDEALLQAAGLIVARVIGEEP